MIPDTFHSPSHTFLLNTGRSATDDQRTHLLIDSLKTSESKLQQYMDQFKLLPVEHIQKNRLLMAFRANLLQRINVEATNLAATWEMLKELNDATSASGTMEFTISGQVEALSDRIENLLENVATIGTGTGKSNE